MNRRACGASNDGTIEYSIGDVPLDHQPSDLTKWELKRLRRIEAAARCLVANPHKFLIEDGNYHVEGAPFDDLIAALQANSEPNPSNTDKP